MPAVRLHGFRRPLDPHQLAAWALLAGFFVFFYVLYAPVFGDPAGVALTVLYSVLAFLTVFFGYKTTRTDPSDPGVRAKREGRRGSEMSPTGAASSGSNYCYLCEASVARRSKHCRRCNKCVAVFDHHCPWVNTCIGAGNYRYFLCMLSAAFAMSALQVGCGIQAMVGAGTGADFEARLRASLGGGMSVALFVTLVGLATLVALMGGTLVSQLLFFHFGLIYRGVTTYEFIISQRTRATQDAGRKRSRAERCGEELQNNAPCLAMCQLCCDEQQIKRAAAQRAAKESVRPPTAPGTSVRHSRSTRTSKQSGVPRSEGKAGSGSTLGGATRRTDAAATVKALSEPSVGGSSRGEDAAQGAARAQTLAEADGFSVRIPSDRLSLAGSPAPSESANSGRNSGRQSFRPSGLQNHMSSALRPKPKPASSLRWSVHPTPLPSVALPPESAASGSPGQRLKLPPIGGEGAKPGPNVEA